MQMLFQGDLGKQTPEQVRQPILGLRAMMWMPRRAGLPRISTALRPRATKDVDKLIEDHAQNWRLERMAVVDRNLAADWHGGAAWIPQYPGGDHHQ